MRIHRKYRPAPGPKDGERGSAWIPGVVREQGDMSPEEIRKLEEQYGCEVKRGGK